MRLVKYVLFIVVTSSLVSYGMSGDRGDAIPGFPRGPYVPTLPSIQADSQTNSAVAQLLEDIAQGWRKKQENAEKRCEESQEQLSKKRKVEKEEDTSEELQLTEALPWSSTTTATTTTTSTLPTQPRRENVQADVWEEWEEIENAIAVRGAREATEVEQDITIRQRVHNLICERFSQLDPDKIADEEYNLIKIIVERFFAHEISRMVSIDELNDETPPAPYVVHLVITTEHDDALSYDEAEHIGRIFTNVRDVLFALAIDDKLVKRLSRQLFAAQLKGLYFIYVLNFSSEAIRNYMCSFTNLTRLAIREAKLGDEGITALAQAPSMRNLTFLDIVDADITDIGFAELSRASFAAHLIFLGFYGNNITKQALALHIAVFAKLKWLSVGREDSFGESTNLGEDGIEAIAQQPFASNLRLAVEEPGVENWIEHYKHRFKEIVKRPWDVTVSKTLLGWGDELKWW